MERWATRNKHFVFTALNECVCMIFGDKMRLKNIINFNVRTIWKRTIVAYSKKTSWNFPWQSEEHNEYFHYEQPQSPATFTGLSFAGAYVSLGRAYSNGSIRSYARIKL
jgi:hypothetical protein